MIRYNERFIKYTNIILFLYFCTWVLVPFFRIYTNQGIFRVSFFILIFMWYVSAVIFSPQFVSDIITTILIIFWALAFMFLYWVLGYGDIEAIRFVRYVLVIFFTHMGLFYLRNATRFPVKKLICYIILCFFATSFTSLIALVNDRDVSRLLTSSATHPEVTYQLARRNIGAFDMVYGSIILLPTIFEIIKVKLRNKNFYSLVLIVATTPIILFVALSNFTIAILLLVIAFVVVLLPKTKRTWLLTTPATVSLVLVFLLFFEDISVTFFEFLLDQTSSLRAQIRYENIIRYIQGNIPLKSLSLRFEYYTNSLQSFSSSPLFGVGAFYNDGAIVGNHSQFLDGFARYGLIGFTPFVILIVYLFKKILGRLIHVQPKMLLIYTAIIYIVLSFVNPVFAYAISFSVLVILPFLIVYLDSSISGER